MENDQLSEQELVMRYPVGIIAWEMKHGIARYERNGVTYICCAKPLADVNASIDRENAELAKRARLRERGLLP